MELINKLNLKTTGNALDKNLILSVAKEITTIGKEVLKIGSSVRGRSFCFMNSLTIGVFNFNREANGVDKTNSDLPNSLDGFFETSFDEIVAIVNDCSSKVITGLQLKYLIVGGILAVKTDISGTKLFQLELVNMDNILNVPDLIEVEMLRHDVGKEEMAMVILDRKLVIVFSKRGAYGDNYGNNL